jgi:2,3-bisphosphoglycerate-independent phosphoglycerate mutase
MYDDANQQPHTQHTTLPVPLVYVGERTLSLEAGGSLADIAPTMLALMDLPQPAEMTGRSLISNT